MSDDDGALAAARDRIALTAIGATAGVTDRLGRLTLRPHQRSAVGRILEMLGRWRGALLADAVGLGKTYVALAVARDHGRPLVVCPAALRPMWERAMRVASVTCPLMNIESLARGERPALEPDLIVVDEAHHFRTPSTRRYAALADLARRARILLLSATPLHNSRRDLTSVLALFIGSEVRAWSDHDLTRLIVRRDENSADQLLPPVIGPSVLSPGIDDDCLEAICRLPVAVPAADEGTAAALAAISLVHLWASSRAALLASLRKRKARAIALRDAIAAGHLPTAGELSAWHYADESLQLAFPFCVATDRRSIDATEVATRLDEYMQGIERLIEGCRATTDPDIMRAELLRTIRAEHQGRRIVAFSQYAQTVTGLGRILRADPGIAIVTASGARIASGSVPRQEILAQFAGDAPLPSATERVDLLLSTDVLSEGVDLRGAAVVVHLDLPWNPARLEQRVGRARRIGSTHSAIHVYTFVPPAAAERMLMLERRLAAKVRIADGIVGGVSLPALAIHPFTDRAPASPVAAGESLRGRLVTWLDPLARRDETRPIVAAAICSRSGWLAVVHLDGLPRLVHCDDNEVFEDAIGFLRLAEQLGPATPVNAIAAAAAMAQLGQWIALKRVAVDLGVMSALPTPKRAVLDRLSQAVARAPRHRRATVLAAVRRARTCVSAIAGVGAERILNELALSVADDDAWIRSVEIFGALHTAGATRPHSDGTCGALILLAPDCLPTRQTP